MFFQSRPASLWRQKGYTVINIGGLAYQHGSAWLFCCTYWMKLQYDTFQTNAKNIYACILMEK